MSRRVVEHFAWVHCEVPVYVESRVRSESTHIDLKKRVAKLAIKCKWKLPLVETDMLHKLMPYLKRMLTLIDIDIKVSSIESLARTPKEARRDK